MVNIRNEEQQALRFVNVHFHYKHDEDQVSILNNTSFSVSKGEFVSIIGASGSGKTTIFRLIVGLEQPNSGSIYLNEQLTTNRLGKVGYMPQQDLLMPWRTIRENAALPLEIQ